VDFIIERDDDKVVVLEAKLTAKVSEPDVTHLRWLHREIGDDLIGAAIIFTGRHAYRGADGIAVIPAALSCRRHRQRHALPSRCV
jgi:hypothetical protein